MPDIEGRYDCPVCLGTKMHKVKIGINNTLILDLCRRCGGIWFDFGEIQQLRNLRSNVLFEKIELNKETFKMQCHSCHSLMGRNASKCYECGWQNIIECPICSKDMKVETIRNLHLDYCQACKGVWFDNIELAEIWNEKLDIHAEHHFSSSKNNSNRSDAASFFIDVLSYCPDLTVYGAEASVEAGKAVVEASANIISNSPEVAGAVVEGMGELSAAVFEAIAEIISDIV